MLFSDGCLPASVVVFLLTYLILFVFLNTKGFHKGSPSCSILCCSLDRQPGDTFFLHLCFHTPSCSFWSSWFPLSWWCPFQYKKRLLLRCLHHFKSNLINNMDHMRISGTLFAYLLFPILSTCPMYLYFLLLISDMMLPTPVLSASFLFDINSGHLLLTILHLPSNPRTLLSICLVALYLSIRLCSIQQHRSYIADI